jgi:superoxide dismutase, Cu-Zn family
MVVRTTLVALAAVCSLAASASRNPATSVTTTPTASRAAQGMKWTATLASVGTSKVAGTATFGPGSAAGTSVATISITGGTPGATYPWHVHTGKCGPGGVVGAGAAYKPLVAGADGTAKGTATVNVATPTSGDYHVNVHASPSDMATIVACGNLGMAGM